MNSSAVAIVQTGHDPVTKESPGHGDVPNSVGISKTRRRRNRRYRAKARVEAELAAIKPD